MANRTPPSNIWEIPKQGLSVAVRVYPRKESGRYGWTQISADQNATLVQDTASGDVYMTDSIVDGLVAVLIRGRIALHSVPLV